MQPNGASDPCRGGSTAGVGGGLRNGAEAGPERMQRNKTLRPVWPNGDKPGAPLAPTVRRGLGTGRMGLSRP